MKSFALWSMLLLLNTSPVFLQTKIDDGSISPSNPVNPNAVLELESNSKGLLPPRVPLTSILSPAPMTAHEAGMIVFNTTVGNGLIEGLYVNDGTHWERLLKGGTINLQPGQIMSYYAEIPIATPNNTYLSSLFTDLLQFEGLMVDLQKKNNTFYIPLVRNTLATTQVVSYSIIGMGYGNNASGVSITVPIGGTISVDMDDQAFWDTSSTETLILNIIVNNRWYEVKWMAYTENNLHKIRMSYMLIS